jgi:hypothetical protein
MVAAVRQLKADKSRPSQASGGVAVIAWNKDVTLQRLQYDSRGVIVVKVNKRDSPAIVLIAVYVPPAGSPFESWCQPILDMASNYYCDYIGQYKGRVFIVGDFNMRLGSHGGRLTEDALAPSESSRAAPLRLLCSKLGISPLHGRPGSFPPASTTSHHIDPTQTGSAEVDYILGCNDLPPDSIQRHATLPWNRTSFTTHRTIACTIAVQGEVAPRAAKQKPRKPADQVQVPSYDDPRHFIMAALISSPVKSLPPPLASRRQWT